MVQEFFYCWKVAKIYIESNFVGVNRLFSLIYRNQDNNSKSYKARRYYIPKGVINNYNAIIKGKSFYDQPNDSGIQWYKEIRKLTTSRGEDHTTEYLLDYEYIKNHYRLIADDLRRQKK